MTLTATVTAAPRAFRVRGHEQIDVTLTFVDGVFAPDNDQVATTYRAAGRCLLVIDRNVLDLYGDRISAYFAAHGIALTVHPVRISETHKSLESVQRIVDAFDAFGLVRTEPVLVVGGGLTTDVAGFACAIYRRGTPYVRVPTTLIGLIDASVSIKVGVNHGRLKNRLGDYHASQEVILDPSLLQTLPVEQVRNGIAELVKISTVGNSSIFALLDEHAEDLLESRFGSLGASTPVQQAARQVIYDAIETMLRLEAPNLHELDLDRVIAHGHTWSPTLELAPETPMLHGHAISIDMAFSATLAERRGLLSAAERNRVLTLMSRLGLAIDSPYLSPPLLEKATTSILATRGGLLRAAVPSPIGTCAFLSDVSVAELVHVLDAHRTLCQGYPREGEGVDMFVGTGALPADDLVVV